MWVELAHQSEKWPTGRSTPPKVYKHNPDDVEVLVGAKWLELARRAADAME